MVRITYQEQNSSLEYPTTEVKLNATCYLPFHREGAWCKIIQHTEDLSNPLSTYAYIIFSNSTILLAFNEEYLHMPILFAVFLDIRKYILIV